MSDLFTQDDYRAVVDSIDTLQGEFCVGRAQRTNTNMLSGIYLVTGQNDHATMEIAG